MSIEREREREKTTMVVGCQREDVMLGLITPSFSSYLLSFSIRHRFIEAVEHRELKIEE